MQINLEPKLSDGMPIDIDDRFLHAIRLMENSRKNVLITGRAGTGKSTLLEYFRRITRKSVAVLAPTGVAALNIKGQTIHSFFKFRPDTTVSTVRRLYPSQKQFYQNVDTIIIDEISMVRADLFDCMDAFMKANGKDPRLPFGGAQMVLVGDLYQLPPVVTKEEEGMFNGPYRSQYFFDSEAFGRLGVEHVELEKHHRQTEDYFIGLLNAIRSNTITGEQLDVLNMRVNASFVPDSSRMYITLTTTNRTADEINSRELARLGSTEHTYKAVIGGDFDSKTFPADEVLRVKEGMQVMMLNNDRVERWVNGSMGIVTGIKTGLSEYDLVQVRLDNGQEFDVGPNKWDMFRFSYDQSERKLMSKSAGSFMQYPIAPAWAVTIHKSQGKTFKNVIIDIGSGTFANGQLYVALSRCTTLRGIILRRPVGRRHIFTDQRIAAFLNGLDAVPAQTTTGDAQASA